MTLISLETETFQDTLPNPEEVQQEIPLNKEHLAFVQQARETIEAILNGWDSRILLIVGPCSIHDPAAALEFGSKLRLLSEQIADRFFVVMRTYFEKPRSTLGWKGLIYDPDIDGSYQMTKGIRLARKLLSDLSDMGLSTGCELLEINTHHYFSDFLSWGCIGARTSSSPPHRQLAASLNLPIGFKNSTDGNIQNAIQGILAASAPHIYMGLSPSGQMVRIQAEGNPVCHVVLRGGEDGPNYHPQSIQTVVQKCQTAKVCTRIIIDCSHDNCSKKPEQQIEAFNSVMEQIIRGNHHIAGLMLESHLQRGSQEISFPLHYGQSITDPCLDWPTTEKMILTAYSQLKK
jgi:3-deoxy-7-phosphoheptulonate synthase